MKSPKSLIRFRNAARAMLAMSAIFAVVISAVTITHGPASAQADLPITVSISSDATDDTVTESNSVTFTVTLGDDVPAGGTNADITVPIIVGDEDEDTATKGEDTSTGDYNVASTEVTFATDSAAGATQTFNMTTRDDSDVEFAETVTVALDTSGDDVVAGTMTSITTTITDNDNENPTGTVYMNVVETDEHGKIVIGKDGKPIVLGDVDADGNTDDDFVPKVGHGLFADTSAIYDEDNDLSNSANPANFLTDPEDRPLNFTYEWARIDGDEDVPIDPGDPPSMLVLTEEMVGGKVTVYVSSSDHYRNGNDIPYLLGEISPEESSTIAYDVAKPFIIVGALDEDDERIEPGVVLTRNSSGLSSTSTDGEGNLISGYYENGDPVSVMVDLDGDGQNLTEVSLSEVTFTWHRSVDDDGGPINECAADGTQTRDSEGDLARDTNTDTNACTDSTYELTNADVAKTITLVASYQTLDASETTDANDVDIFAPFPSISDSVYVFSPNKPTGVPTISGIGQVGRTLTVSIDGIEDADGLSAPMFRYQWLRGGEPIAGAVFSSYTLTGADGGEMISVVVSFVDDVAGLETILSAETLPIVASPGKISRIEPAIVGVTVSGGDSVTLSVDVYGRQDAKDNDLSGTFTWTVDDEVDGDLGSGREAMFTAPDDPGRYTVAASLEAVDCYDEDDDEACTAEFTIMVRRPSAPQPPEDAPANPPGAIPGILADADGNQYEVFTPEEGGTFDGGGGYSISVPSGAVPNGEFIGIRMSDDGAASNAGMTHQRYTLGGNMYGVHAVDASGAAISRYVLETPAEVCVPLPASLRTNISGLSLAAINSDGSLTILAAQVRLDESGGTMVCGNLSSLPASVAVGSAGAPAAIPTPMPDPTPEPPDTGGTAPTSSTLMLWTLLLGIAVLTLGSALTISRRLPSIPRSPSP